MAKDVKEIGTTPIGMDSGPKMQITAAINAVVVNLYILDCFFIYHNPFVYVFPQFSQTESQMF